MKELHTQVEQQAVVDQAKSLLAPLWDDIRKLLHDLVRVNTVAVPPHGDETPAQRVLADFLTSHGLSPELYEVAFIQQSGSPYLHAGRNYAGRMNLQAVLPGTGGGRSLLLNGHMDTVPTAPERWTDSPWSPVERDGRTYGLGTFDMKAGLVAQAAVLAALKRGDIELSGDVIFESVVDEEWGGGGGSLAARLRGLKADACVICEGTQLEVYRATRGGFTVDLHCTAGDASAYFSSARVVSPAIPLGRLLGWVDQWVERRGTASTTGAYQHVPDPTPVQVLAVESNRLALEVPLSVPQEATVRVYFQFLPEEDVPAVITEIQQSLREFERQDAFFSAYPIQWRPVVDPPLLGHELAIDHPWTECLYRNAKSALGDQAAVTAAPYPCDAFLMDRFGIPTLLFGPCGAGAHNPDEYVDTESVLRTAEVLLAAALDWCQ